jgi:predicted PurR-regulated permease PerM
VSQRKYNASEVLKNIFRVSFDAEDGSQPKPFNVVKYFVLPLVFAAALAVLFYYDLQKLYDLGGDLSDVSVGMFTLLLSLVFAIVGVYLVIHVLHPYFGKRPVPAKLEKIIDEETDSDMTREELHDFLEDLRSNDEEIREYSDSIDVKTLTR